MGSQPRFRPDRGLHFLHRTISKRVHELAAAEDYPGPALPVPHVRSNGGHLGEGAGLARTPSSRSEEHTSELQSLMRISYAVFCLKTKITQVIEEDTQNNKR